MAPVVSILRASAGFGPVDPPGGSHPKAILEAEKGTRLVLPFAPRATTLGGLADTWEKVRRPGRSDLLLHTGKRSPTMSMSIFLAHSDSQESIEGMLGKLEALGTARERVTLSNMSPLERGPWRITALEIGSTNRQYGTNHITQATATLTFEEASDPLSRRGPLSGGKDSGDDTKATRYTVKKGDNLRKIADRFYGSPDKWKAIAKANDIKKASAELKPGRVLTIPPKK